MTKKPEPMEKKETLLFLSDLMRQNNRYTKRERVEILMTKGVAESTAYWFDKLFMQDEQWESVRDKTNQVLEDKNRALRNCRHNLYLAEQNEDEEKITFYSKELLTLNKLSRNF